MRRPRNGWRKAVTTLAAAILLAYLGGASSPTASAAEPQSASSAGVRPTSASAPSAAGLSRPAITHAEGTVPTWVTVLRERGQRRINNAYDLASRGAIYSGQQELFGVLGMVAQTIDTQHGTTQHTAALDSALLALKEADDFRPTATPGTRDADLKTILASHQSRILRPEEAELVTTLTALQRYYSHVQKQLVFAARGEPLAAEALYGLGRLQSLQDDATAGRSFSEQKTLVFYMAAVSVDPRHYVAANELGVVLTRLGQYGYAQKALEQSVAVSAATTNCGNLLAIYERNGDHERASQLRQQCRSLDASSPSANGAAVPEVAWVSAEVFAQSGPAGELEQAAFEVPEPLEVRPTTTAAHHKSPPAANTQSRPASSLRRWLGRVKETVTR